MQNPIRVNKYGFEVWENPKADAVRKEECLCTHCKFMTQCPVRVELNAQPGHVGLSLPLTQGAAQLLFEICTYAGMAMCITRCPKWEAK